MCKFQNAVPCRICIHSLTCYSGLVREWSQHLAYRRGKRSGEAIFHFITITGVSTSRPLQMLSRSEWVSFFNYSHMKMRILNEICLIKSCFFQILLWPWSNVEIYVSFAIALLVRLQTIAQGGINTNTRMSSMEKPTLAAKETHFGAAGPSASCGCPTRERHREAFTLLSINQSIAAQAVAAQWRMQCHWQVKDKRNNSSNNNSKCKTTAEVKEL